MVVEILNDRHHAVTLLLFAAFATAAERANVCAFHGTCSRLPGNIPPQSTLANVGCDGGVSGHGPAEHFRLALSLNRWINPCTDGRIPRLPIAPRLSWMWPKTWNDGLTAATRWANASQPPRWSQVPEGVSCQGRVPEGVSARARAPTPLGSTSATWGHPRYLWGLRVRTRGVSKV